ncbi:unnamed protein product [Heligmosomoides polygyrus]|uniref:Lethal giant larvae homologue 2 domain-containing protein n=1 Tax=Heligmosomoides polygyrus TaxID=6339 RepID=A0A3P7ZQR5_HELPZ|nr:unnamed protein product [Heligmosomoides polygyrus]
MTSGDDGYHTSAIVLTENELVCIDLTDRCWRIIPTEQIFPLHASQLSEEELGRNREFSAKPWPLRAKIPTSDETRVVKEATKRQLYVTGHENGTVRIWSCGHAVMRLLFVIDTRKEFVGLSEEKDAGDNKTDDYGTDSSDDEFQITGEWPPFKKVGEYDPFCDDAGLSIQKVAFDEKSGHVVIGLRGGHVFVYSLEETEKVCPFRLTPQSLQVEMCELSKLSAHTRNCKALPIRETSIKYQPGYQPYSTSQNKRYFRRIMIHDFLFEPLFCSMVVELQPAVAVSAVAVLSSRHLVAASNEYGFALIDISKQSVLLQNSLVNHYDMSHVGALDDALSRFKSMKKSIRQTFRRKKKTPVASLDNTIGTANSESSTRETSGMNTSKVFSDHEDEEVMITKPVERLIEERGLCPADSPVWFIRCLKFLTVPVLGIAGISDVFVVGTNGGKLIIYSITDQPRAEDVCKLMKTISLRHGAPIIHVDVILEPGTKQASSTRLIIFTEEQIRSFYLPSLKPSRYKVKLTSTEGLRIRKASMVTLHNLNDLSNCESFAAIVNNHGEVAIYSLLNPKKSEKFAVVKSTDIAGISSMLVTPYGELLYLRQGGSELQRATISEHSLPWTLPGQGVQWPEHAT